MAWLLYGCDHSGSLGFGLAIWATLATGIAIEHGRRARMWHRLLVEQVEGETRRRAEARH